MILKTGESWLSRSFAFPPPDTNDPSLYQGNILMFDATSANPGKSLVFNPTSVGTNFIAVNYGTTAEIGPDSPITSAAYYNRYATSRLYGSKCVVCARSTSTTVWVVDVDNHISTDGVKGVTVPSGIWFPFAVIGPWALLSTNAGSGTIYALNMMTFELQSYSMHASGRVWGNTALYRKQGSSEPFAKSVFIANTSNTSAAEIVTLNSDDTFTVTSVSMSCSAVWGTGVSASGWRTMSEPNSMGRIVVLPNSVSASTNRYSLVDLSTKSQFLVTTVEDISLTSPYCKRVTDRWVIVCNDSTVSTNGLCLIDLNNTSTGAKIIKVLATQMSTRQTPYGIYVYGNKAFVPCANSGTNGMGYIFDFDYDPLTNTTEGEFYTSVTAAGYTAPSSNVHSISEVTQNGKVIVTTGAGSSTIWVVDIKNKSNTAVSVTVPSGSQPWGLAGAFSTPYKNKVLMGAGGGNTITAQLIDVSGVTPTITALATGATGAMTCKTISPVFNGKVIVLSGASGTSAAARCIDLEAGTYQARDLSAAINAGNWGRYANFSETRSGDPGNPVPTSMAWTPSTMSATVGDTFTTVLSADVYPAWFNVLNGDGRDGGTEYSYVLSGGFSKSGTGSGKIGILIGTSSQAQQITGPVTFTITVTAEGTAPGIMLAATLSKYKVYGSSDNIIAQETFNSTITQPIPKLKWTPNTLPVYGNTAQHTAVLETTDGVYPFMLGPGDTYCYDHTKPFTWIATGGITRSGTVNGTGTGVIFPSMTVMTGPVSLQITASNTTAATNYIIADGTGPGCRLDLTTVTPTGGTWSPQYGNYNIANPLSATLSGTFTPSYTGTHWFRTMYVQLQGTPQLRVNGVLIANDSSNGTSIQLEAGVAVPYTMSATRSSATTNSAYFDGVQMAAAGGNQLSYVRQVWS